jgi:CxxC motif-containing protein
MSGGLKDKTITCINCPRGCAMKVQNRDEGYIVIGNKCRRGISYGISEFENPVRLLTTTVRVTGGTGPVVSVRTDRPIPKDRIFEAMRLINAIQLHAPVIFGDIILKDIAGVGANIVATSEIRKKTGGI